MYEHPRTHQVAVSVTSVISVIDKPAIKYWAAKQAAEYAAEHAAELVTLDREERFKRVKEAPWSKTADAADAGNTVHDWIDKWIQDRLIPDVTDASLTAARMWRSFLVFCERYNPEWMDSEFTVWSDQHDYAGTADWAAKINGAVILGDTKTGKGVYPEVGLQLAALANADHILRVDGHEDPLPKFERFGVLHIRPTFARLAPVVNVDHCFNAFLAARHVKAWKDLVSDSVVLDSPKLLTTV